MDTVCYLCRQRLKNPIKSIEDAYAIREFLFPDYRLAIIRLHELFWEETSGDGASVFSVCARRRKRKAKRLAQAGLREDLSAILDPYGENYCVSSGTLHAGISPGELLALPEFECYLDQNWVERLLPYAIYPRFVVLGNMPYLPELFRGLARKMKSLLWVLPDHYYTEMLEDFAEDFYQEYGLAIALRFLEADVTFGQAQVELGRVREPVNVLDFTENKGIPRINLPEGSVWLDMASVGEKERKLLARGYRVSYFSLKKQWEEPQKAPCLLDTAPKNRYNTVS